MSYPSVILLAVFVCLTTVASADGCRQGGYGNRPNQGEGGHQHQGGGGPYKRWDVPMEEARRLNPVAVSDESLQRGKTLFQTHCMRCHGEFGMGDGPDAAGLKVQPPYLRHAARHYTDGEIDWIVRTGRDPMPSWKDTLNQDQRWDLINYVRFDLATNFPGHAGGGGRGGCQERGGGPQMQNCPREQRQEGCPHKHDHQSSTATTPASVELDSIKPDQ